jgi:hypothetical protein
LRLIFIYFTGFPLGGTKTARKMREVLRALKEKFEEALEEYNSAVDPLQAVEARDVFKLVESETARLAKSSYWVVS